MGKDSHSPVDAIYSEMRLFQGNEIRHHLISLEPWLDFSPVVPNTEFNLF